MCCNPPLMQQPQQQAGGCNKLERKDMYFHSKGGSSPKEHRLFHTQAGSSLLAVVTFLDVVDVPTRRLVTEPS